MNRLRKIYLRSQKRPICLVCKNYFKTDYVKEIKKLLQAYNYITVLEKDKEGEVYSDISLYFEGSDTYQLEANGRRSRVTKNHLKGGREPYLFNILKKLLQPN